MVTETQQEEQEEQQEGVPETRQEKEVEEKEGEQVIEENPFQLTDCYCDVSNNWVLLISM